MDVPECLSRRAAPSTLNTDAHTGTCTHTCHPAKGRRGPGCQPQNLQKKQTGMGAVTPGRPCGCGLGMPEPLSSPGACASDGEHTCVCVCVCVCSSAPERTDQRISLYFNEQMFSENQKTGSGGCPGERKASAPLPALNMSQPDIFSDSARHRQVILATRQWRAGNGSILLPKCSFVKPIHSAVQPAACRGSSLVAMSAGSPELLPLFILFK